MYKKIGEMAQESFFLYLNMAVYDEFVICKMQHDISRHLSDFRLDLIRGVLGKFGSQRPTTIGRPSTTFFPLRLFYKHHDYNILDENAWWAHPVIVDTLHDI